MALTVLAMVVTFWSLLSMLSSPYEVVRIGTSREEPVIVAQGQVRKFAPVRDDKTNSRIKVIWMGYGLIARYSVTDCRGEPPRSCLANSMS
jgi:hypothetical protein